jgi:hypothetical protein
VTEKGQKALTYLPAQKQTFSDPQTRGKAEVSCHANVASKKEPLRFERVNAVTLKLTDGKMIQTPRSHGQWPGFNTTRAVAWVINAGWPLDGSGGLARCGEQAHGPVTLAEAKSAAILMARRKFAGPVATVTDPAGRLNRLAVLLEEFNKTAPSPMAAFHPEPALESENFA